MNTRIHLWAGVIFNLQLNKKNTTANNNINPKVGAQPAKLPGVCQVRQVHQVRHIKVWSGAAQVEDARTLAAVCMNPPTSQPQPSTPCASVHKPSLSDV